VTPEPPCLPPLPAAALADGKSLRAIDLSRNPVGGEGALAVAQLVGGKRIRMSVVGLRGCCINGGTGDGSAADLLVGMLQATPSLRRVDLRENEFDEQGEWAGSCWRGRGGGACQQGV
jgi:hypothetical protein